MPDLDPAPILDALAGNPRLRVFVGNGRIETIPAKHSRRLLLLDQIAQAFEPGLRYPERDVSLFLGGLHPDFCSLRRYLVDEEFFIRAGGREDALGRPDSSLRQRARVGEPAHGFGPGAAPAAPSHTFLPKEI